MNATAMVRRLEETSPKVKARAGGVQIDPRDDSRVSHPFALGSFLPVAGRKGRVLLRFGFSLANLSLALVRHHHVARFQLVANRETHAAQSLCGTL